MSCQQYATKKAIPNPIMTISNRCSRHVLRALRAMISGSRNHQRQPVSLGVGGGVRFSSAAGRVEVGEVDVEVNSDMTENEAAEF
jgi:hypothetical protein